VKVFDIARAQQALQANAPLMPEQVFADHRAEVSSVSWNQVSTDNFISAGWDSTIRLFALGQPQCIAAFGEHVKEVYEASWSPRDNFVFSSVSGDGFWKLWDVRRGQRATASVPGHNGEIILSTDWNKYEPTVIYTASTDRTVKMWDIRNPSREIFALRGHANPVRRVRCSPHSRNMVLSSGYDFRVCLWDLDRPQRPLVHRYEHHREFVPGLTWSMTTPGQVASCSWDGMVFQWTLGQPLVPTHQNQPPMPVAVPPPRDPALAAQVRRRSPGPPLPPMPPR
jgi:peroxin-7